MKLHKLHLFFILSAACHASRAVALPRRALLSTPQHRRDHGDPFIEVAPTEPTSSTTLAPTETPAPVVVSATSPIPQKSLSTSAASIPSSTLSISSTTSISITTSSTSSASPSPTSITSTAVSSSSTPPPPLPTTTTSTSLVASLTAAVTATSSPTALAPTTSSSSSSSTRPWIIALIFALSFSLAGLLVFICAGTRRRKIRKARSARKKALQRQVEPVAFGKRQREGREEVEVMREEGLGGDVGVVVVQRDERGRKWEEVVEGMERGKEREREKERERQRGRIDGDGGEEWEEGLPAYSR